MTEVVNSLFGITPESLQQQRAKSQQEEAYKFAQLDPNQAATAAFYQAGQRGGDAMAGMLGYQDPQMKIAATRQQLLKQAKLDSPEGYQALAKQLADAGDQQGAMDVLKMMRTQMQETAVTNKAVAEEKKINLSVAQEEKLRTELDALKQPVSQEDIINVVMKYGPPDKVLAVLQGSADREAARTQAKELAEERYRLERERIAQTAATAADRLRMEEDAKRRHEETLRMIAASKQSNKDNSPLPLKDIQEVNKLRNNVKNADTNIGKATEFISGLEGGKGQYGLLSNAASWLRTGVGNSTEADRFKQDINRFTVASVNAILNLAKGPQTDRDAERAKEQVLTGLQKNDKASVLAGLKELQRLHTDARSNDAESLQLFSQERNRDFTVAPPKAGKPGSKENPIKLD